MTDSSSILQPDQTQRTMSSSAWSVGEFVMNQGVHSLVSTTKNNSQIPPSSGALVALPTRPSHIHDIKPETRWTPLRGHKRPTTGMIHQLLAHFRVMHTCSVAILPGKLACRFSSPYQTIQHRPRHFITDLPKTRSNNHVRTHSLPESYAKFSAYKQLPDRIVLHADGPWLTATWAPTSRGNTSASDSHGDEPETTRQPTRAPPHLSICASRICAS